MLSGEFAARAAKLKREQQERVRRKQQREEADKDALRRQQERIKAAEEEGRQRRLAELARQDEMRLQASDGHCDMQPHHQQTAMEDDSKPTHRCRIYHGVVNISSFTDIAGAPFGLQREADIANNRGVTFEAQLQALPLDASGNTRGIRRAADKVNLVALPCRWRGTPPYAGWTRCG